MIKLCLVFFLLLYGFTAKAQNGVCDSLSWSADRKLTWDDYKALPDNGTKATALTHYNLAQQWSVRGYTLTAKMVCFFSPCLSWSKNKNSPRLLEHEQGHFDIGEYFRRLYYQRLTQATYTPATIKPVIQNIYLGINLDCETMQNAYDRETNHSLNEDKQKEWLQKINSLLRITESLNKESYIIPLTK